ncbi:MAG TPA: MMPL family transporter [Polyangiaceae bacterium]|jgi:hypothetical protein
MKRVGADAYVAWVLRYGRSLWIAALIVSVPAFVRVQELYAHLRSEVEQLLPEGAPSVAAIRELRSRMPGMQYLGVVVDSGSEANLPAAEHLLDDLASRVRQYPRWLVRTVRTGDGPERSFVEDNAALYVDLDDLREVRRRLEARRDRDVSKDLGLLLDDDAPAPPISFDDLQRKYDERTGAHRFDDGRFSSKALHLTLLLVQLGDFDTGRARGSELVARVRDDLRALGGPSRYAPGMRVGFAGDVAISVEETSALVADLSLSTVVVVVLVGAALLVYFRWWPSLVVLLAPLTLATVFAFAIVSLPPASISELNSNTAFLGSIIVGNGINFAIVLLARHLEERRAGRSVEDALATAVRGTLRPTLLAALAAGASYASLALTDFRGFRQFGYIGGVGMVFSWAAAFLLMPPLVARMDAEGARAPSTGRPRFSPAAALGRLVEEHPRVIVAVSLALTLASLAEARGFDGRQIETDFSKLRRADTWQTGEGYWGRRMEALLGTYLTPTILLTDSVEQSRRIEASLRSPAWSAPLSGRIASVRTIDDVVPDHQEDKLAEAAALREDLTPRVLASVSEKSRELLERLAGTEGMRPLTAADLPESMTQGLRERDGTLGREVLVFPRPSRELWQAAPLAELVGSLRTVAHTRGEPSDRSARVAGSLPLSADILASIRRDGVRASVAALVGVVGVVFLVLRATRASVLVVGSLLVAVGWLVAAMMAFGVRVNFADFIAYPITFGIGVDYAANVAGRYLQGSRRDVGKVLGSTGGAVALCSCTTIIGYSSLLMAENRGLFSFGVVAVCGELCCLSTAVLAMPALLRWAELGRAGVSALRSAPQKP